MLKVIFVSLLKPLLTSLKKTSVPPKVQKIVYLFQNMKEKTLWSWCSDKNQELHCSTLSYTYALLLEKSLSLQACTWSGTLYNTVNTETESQEVN